MNNRPGLKLLLLNLLIVASLGVLMRYKIAFEFPYFEQKNIQHAHSHFAFSGWITQALMLFICQVYEKHFNHKQIKIYNTLLWLNYICSFGMLFSFFLQGYAFFSILFSSLSIILISAFAAFFYNSTRLLTQKPASLKWLYAALFFGILSALGTAELAYLMMHKITNQFLYLSSIYFYLHFQYNGWFFFGCIGILLGLANNQNISLENDKLIFKLFASSCVPAYFLSTLWANIPIWLFILCIAAAISQFIAWLLLLKSTIKYVIKSFTVPYMGKYLIYFMMLAITVKFTLQLGSTIPSISKLAFGFRPIVIAYLHLVLLAIISMLLIVYMLFAKQFVESKTLHISIYLFSFFVFMNELILGIQGISSLFYVSIPYINIVLFVIAIGLFNSILLIWTSQLNGRSSELI